jgi:hypothetical protein
MFVQFIEGSVSDPDAFRSQLERWRDDVADPIGWLGTTAGITEGGTAFVSARFDSAESARANSDRPEQAEWWASTERLFDGGAAFADHEDVEVFRSGGSDDAGFVQVLRGTVTDPAAARELFGQGPPDDGRPDVLGGYVGLAPDGTYTMVVYFTSEAEARRGEREEAAAGSEYDERMAALHPEPPRFLDLTDPWLWSP